MQVHTIRWEDGTLRIIDQTLLPTEYKHTQLNTLEDVWEAIRSLRVRGAPAIGVCAAYGILVALRETQPRTTEDLVEEVCRAAGYLRTSRPTAVNLFWALDRMEQVAASIESVSSVDEAFARLEAEAELIYEEDRQICRQIGENGAALIQEETGVLTHCNAGGLATSEFGTALSVMYAAHREGRQFRVFADETRPLLQGARLTAWELMQAGIDVTLICDNAAAQVMREGKVQLVVVGADRIAANGDTANKIGTYSVALSAQAHGIPFYVAAPTSTIDMTLSHGDLIPIEQRAPEEIVSGFGRDTAPSGVQVYNPAFDVTPARLITGIITEKGILRPPYTESIAECMAAPESPAL